MTNEFDNNQNQTSEENELYDKNLIAGFVIPLPENNGVGQSVRYSNIFDEIREARREEDSNLSQGVWEIEFKKADWETVEKLSTQVLTNQSKDLQVAIWLTEAWIIKDGLKGLKRGLHLLNELNSAFWDNIHPQIDDDDQEHRIHIFEWFDKEIYSRCLLLPLARSVIDTNSVYLTMDSWVHAIELDKMSKRSKDPKNLINTALAKGKVDLKTFRKILTTTPVNFLSDIKKSAQKSSEQLHILQKFLEDKIGHGAPSINRLNEVLINFQRLSETGIEHTQTQKASDQTSNEDTHKNIENLINATDEDQNEQKKNTNTSEDGPVLISERQHAYQALRDISVFLSSLEPHSPVPQLLQMIGGWESKTITEVLLDVRSQPTELRLLLRLLADAANESIPPSPESSPQNTPDTFIQPSTEMPPKIDSPPSFK